MDFEVLASGYTLVEAIRGAADGTVHFSDALGGGVYRRSPDGSIETVVPGRRGVGGQALHADGGVIVSGRQLVHVRGDEQRILFAPEGATGLNDLCVLPDGSVVAGVLRYHPFKGEDPVPGDFWRIDPDGHASRLFGDVIWPNGVCVSPDGTRIYAADYARKHVLVFDGDDARVFAAPEQGSCDGLAMDGDGCVWVATGEGGAVARFLPDGSPDRILDAPASFVASIGFAGPEMRDLIVGTLDNSLDPDKGGTLFRTRVDVSGMPMPLARV